MRRATGTWSKLERAGQAVDLLAGPFSPLRTHLVAIDLAAATCAAGKGELLSTKFKCKLTGGLTMRAMKHRSGSSSRKLRLETNLVTRWYQDFNALARGAHACCRRLTRQVCHFKASYWHAKACQATEIANCHTLWPLDRAGGHGLFCCMLPCVTHLACLAARYAGSGPLTLRQHAGKRPRLYQTISLS